MNIDPRHVPLIQGALLRHGHRVMRLQHADAGFQQRVALIAEQLPHVELAFRGSQVMADPAQRDQIVARYVEIAVHAAVEQAEADERRAQLMIHRAQFAADPHFLLDPDCTITQPVSVTSE